MKLRWLPLVFVALACSSRGEVLFVEPLPAATIVPAPPRPVLVTPDGGAALPRPAADVFVSAGATHACALVGGRAYCFGNNADGQLGVGDRDDRGAPMLVSSALTLTELAAGDDHTCGLDDAGGVHCWGGNARGQLGQGDRSARPSPTAVALPRRAVRLFVGFSHSCAILSDAALYCWGQNSEGDLGQGDPYVSDDSADGLVPLRVPLEGARVAGIGQGHLCAIVLDGSLYCWGRNSERELGTAEPIQLRSPVRVGTDTDWHTLALGQHHSCALRADESLWCWGQNTAVSNEEGAPLGVADVEQLDEPTRVSDASWRELSTHTFHTCAINRDGELFCWGRGIEGQLGLSSAFEPVPRRIPGEFARVAAGHFFTCAVTTEGLVACTGANDSGQLGLGDRERRAEFSSAE